MYKYDNKAFPFEGKDISTNYPDQNYYDKSFYLRKAEITTIGIKSLDASTGNLKVWYNAKLDGEPYNLKFELNKYYAETAERKEKKKKEIVDVVGNDIFNLSMSMFPSGGQSPNVQGFWYTMPIVIEYKVGGISCTACKKDVLNPTLGEIACSIDSCSLFDNPACGCYVPEPPIEQVTPPADTSSSCKTAIQWSETQNHTFYHSGGCKKKKDGGSYCPGHSCNHVYTYKSTLSTAATLKSAKPNGGATIFKSGYGFTVSVNNSLATGQISNAGACGKSLTKANSQKPAAPTNAEVRNNWTVINKQKKYTQPKTVALQNTGSTANGSTFFCAPNKVSNYSNKQIYTDVALKGTKQKPVRHSITMYTVGGGVNGVQFCQSVPLSFTINGNMHEDDATVDTRNR